MIKKAKDVVIGDFIMSDGSFKKVKKIIIGELSRHFYSPLKFSDVLIGVEAVMFELEFDESEVRFSYSNPFFSEELVQVRSDKREGNPHD